MSAETWCGLLQFLEEPHGVALLLPTRVVPAALVLGLEGVRALSPYQFVKFTL